MPTYSEDCSITLPSSTGSLSDNSGDLATSTACPTTNYRNLPSKVAFTVLALELALRSAKRRTSSTTTSQVFSEWHKTESCTFVPETNTFVREESGPETTTKAGWDLSQKSVKTTPLCKKANPKNQNIQPKK